jgi:hypothetical protein
MAAASPSRSGSASPVAASPTLHVSPRPATPATPLATIAPISPTPITKLVEGCNLIRYQGTPRPEDPISVEYEALARPLYGFAEEVRRTELILVGTLREIFPSRWNTSDGTRPRDLHVRGSNVSDLPPIFTPMQIETERIVTGSYAFASLYLAKFRGQIGQDCYVFFSAFDSAHGLSPGQQSLFFLFSMSTERILQRPLADDPRYRFYGVSRTFPVAANGTIRFPVLSETREEYYSADREIPLAQAIREIDAPRIASTPTPAR